MAASIDDSILKEALEFRRSLFFQTLPHGLSQTLREKNWVAYLFSLSQSSTPSRTNDNDPACVKREHVPPLPAGAPEAKRRRRVRISRRYFPYHADSAVEYGRFAAGSSSIAIPTILDSEPPQQKSRWPFSFHQYRRSCAHACPQSMVQH